MNQLILGDNLEIMQKMDNESVDLIYLDPPFFSNRNYEVIWGDKGEIRSFEDRWSGGIEHYIAWLKERVAEMHRILKPNGSIFLHCDWHANSYIRIYILDDIFKEQNFRNEIIWAYLGPGSPGVKQFLKKHDTIFWYSKGTPWAFNLDDVRFPHSDKTKANFKEGLVGSGFEGAPREINKKGKVPEDWWTDISIAARFPRGTVNNIGYPTQKPEKLLERIILACSSEGDIVMDPFVGGGTTIAVADRLNRKWIGIDQSVQAVKVSEMRLNNQQNFFSLPFSVTLHKYDYDTLRYKDAFEFESWIITQFGYKFGFPAIPQKKKGGDKGFDGKTKTDGAPIQVKRSDNISVNVIKNFYSSCVINDRAGTNRRKEAGEPIGYIIAFTFGSGAIQEVAKLRIQENIIIKLLRVDEIVEIAHKPKLTIKMNDLGFDSKNLREIEFIAIGESTAGIEFYSWDFEFNEVENRFNANIMLDKDGKQTHKFKPGYHIIAVKVVDNEGLEAVEAVKVKINGEIKIN